MVSSIGKDGYHAAKLVHYQMSLNVRMPLKMFMYIFLALGKVPSNIRLFIVQVVNLPCADIKVLILEKLKFLFLQI